MIPAVVDAKIENPIRFFDKMKILPLKFLTILSIKILEQFFQRKLKKVANVLKTKPKVSDMKRYLKQILRQTI